MATYFMKDQDKKWGAEVVEVTSQSIMKIRFVYVVKGTTTTLSFVEVANIKRFTL